LIDLVGLGGNNILLNFFETVFSAPDLRGDKKRLFGEAGHGEKEMCELQVDVRVVLPEMIFDVFTR